MNTIKTKQIGSHTIIDRFDKLPIDPELTRLGNKTTISKFAEKIALDEKLTKKNAYNAKANDATSKIRVAAKYINDAKTLVNFADDDAKKQIAINIERANAIISSEETNRLNSVAQSSACDCEINDLGNALECRRRDHIRENPLHSHPRKNEVVLTDAKYTELKALFDARENQQICVTLEMIDTVIQEAIGDIPEIKSPIPKFISHEIIDDFIGCQYFFNDGKFWIESEIITELGVTKENENAMELKDLLPEQQEEIRIQKLTPEQKESEKLGAIQGALSRAGMMKNELEIVGDPEFLAKSQEFYQTTVAEIETKYI